MLGSEQAGCAAVSQCPQWGKHLHFNSGIGNHGSLFLLQFVDLNTACEDRMASGLKSERQKSDRAVQQPEVSSSK